MADDDALRIRFYSMVRVHYPPADYTSHSTGLLRGPGVVLR
jgi:hypothetical protein